LFYIFLFDLGIANETEDRKEREKGGKEGGKLGLRKGKR